MKAVVYTKYGPPEVLKHVDIEQPKPKDDEVLVSVHAASVNSWDWDRLTGRPYLYRLLSGISKPKLQILGADVAGEVVKVGNSVTRFSVGDEIFGDLSDGNWGAFAEFVCAKENELVLKPQRMSWEQAAAIPQAGVMAVQGLFDQKQLHPGQKVLMNGAGGGVGSFVLQMAKALNLHITGIDSAAKQAFMTSLGADEVIDYTKTDFTKNGQQYDLIIDVVANRSVYDYKHSLAPGGVYVMIGGKIPTVFQVGLLGPLVSGKNGKKIGILGIKPNKGLPQLIKLFEAGKVKPVIDKIFPLSETGKALQYIGDGHVKGKVIIAVNA